MTAHPVQSWRQRTPPPAPQALGHSRTSTGGPPALGKLVAGFVRQLRDRFYGGSSARYPGTVFDRLILRDRHPTMYRPTYMPPGDSQPSWTAAGPARPTMHMRQMTWRNWVGSSSSRFPFVPDSPTGGMHTNVEQAVPRTRRRYMAVAQQRPARQHRLSPARYHGQSYSQQTTIQGG